LSLVFKYPELTSRKLLINPLTFSLGDVRPRTDSPSTVYNEGVAKVTEFERISGFYEALS